MPRLPPTAYTLLLHMMTEQETGGLVVATHDELATGLAMERGMISRAMPHLVAARLITVVRRGRFQLHPMIAAFNDPREQQRAIKALPKDMRLDAGDFEDEYERRFCRRRPARPRRRPRATSRPSPNSSAFPDQPAEVRRRCSNCAAPFLVLGEHVRGRCRAGYGGHR
ncbi:hypothetical protein [Streptomyces sp. NBC_01320]|uniref:hypothetical protein n=1 Tax=Streptomyces sp. NBC_01320 TaxID=2903824 RepID=UPI002E11A8B0|nr:hypothetical protein OG395_01130 [Streptomyces sp. NBC_01320]WSK01038.1 hypothetical protein OG395_54225 [Streptomyces sp. NBC_01320]